MLFLFSTNSTLEIHESRGSVFDRADFCILYDIISEHICMLPRQCVMGCGGSLTEALQLGKRQVRSWRRCTQLWLISSTHRVCACADALCTHAHNPPPNRLSPNFWHGFLWFYGRLERLMRPAPLYNHVMLWSMLYDFNFEWCKVQWT